jgi:hypothetical protein
VPTTRPRHTITETEPVKEVLDELRAALGGEPIDFPELVMRGARLKIDELRREDARRAAGLKELADEIRNRTLVVGDPELVEEAKRGSVKHVHA